MKFKALFVATVTVLLSAAAQATIINLDATVEGYTQTETFAAGTYNVTWIGIAGGGLYDAWGAATASSPSGHAKYRDAVAVSFNLGPVQRSDMGYFGPYDPDTAASALAYAQAHPVTLTFDKETTAVFSIPDNPGQFGDNTGGVSLSITQAVPEPETYALMIAGLGAMAFVGRRRSGKAKAKAV